MQVNFSQIYIEPGVSFRYSYLFQNRLSEAISALVRPSSQFAEQYGVDSDLIVNVSAKVSLVDNEVRGPAVFRKALKSTVKSPAKKPVNVEYTVFIPYRVVMQSLDPDRTAIVYLLNGTCTVLESLGIDTSAIRTGQDSLVDELVSDPSNFE